MRNALIALGAVGALAVGGVSTAGATPAPSVVHLSAPVSGLRYNQKLVHTRAGRIKIVFLSRSALKHNVNVELGEHEYGKSATVTKATTSFFVTLKAGKYNFYCSGSGSRGCRHARHPYRFLTELGRGSVVPRRAQPSYVGRDAAPLTDFR